MSCTDPLRNLLPAWVAGELDGPEAGRVEAHAAACPECAGLAETLREIAGATEPFGTVEPPDGLETTVSGRSCPRWQAALTAALDGELPEDRLGQLLEHMESCAGCSAVWTALTVLREAGEALTVPPGLEARCRAVPGAERSFSLPGTRTAVAVAYAAALVVSLVLGNPVALARNQMHAVTGHIGRTVRTGVVTLRDEGRGELRMLVWRAWRMGNGVAAVVRSAFRPVTGSGPDDRKGERA